MKVDSTVAHGSTFLVTGPDGRPSRAHDGLYHRDTRHLSAYRLDAADRELETLRTVDARPGQRVFHRASAMEGGARALNVRQRQVVTDALHDRIEVTNLSRSELSDALVLTVAADFQDMFEVRGFSAPRDRDVDVEILSDGVRFGYDPSDVEFSRRSTVRATGVRGVERREDGRAVDLELPVSLAPGETAAFSAVAAPEEAPEEVEAAVAAARRSVRERAADWHERADVPSAEPGAWQSVLERSVEDLLALTIDTGHGPLLAAGLPWFATAFGRDSLIAAYQALPVAPDLARGTLRYLAAHQAAAVDERRGAAPGKILHELRRGELAARGEVPHTPYYGTVDATALWVVLLHETWALTGDDDLLDDLAGNLDAALEWLADYADRDDDGFLEYPTDRGAHGGLTHQAWKDSGDGILAPDGTHPDGPLAVAEVQGYYYDAKRRAADMLRSRGERERADRLLAEAADLRAAFDDAFWLPREEYYAVALDGANEPVPAVTSNPGHCLWSELVPDERADAVVDRLLADDMFAGWGVRTFSAAHDAFNPQSYHLGSVWPHDNSLVALGMANYGRRDAAASVAEGLFEAAVARGNDRLPELFAGFDRSETAVPIPYGAACEPQAWAAGAPLLALEAARGGRETQVGRPTRGEDG